MRQIREARKFGDDDTAHGVGHNANAFSNNTTHAGGIMSTPDQGQSGTFLPGDVLKRIALPFAPTLRVNIKHDRANIAYKKAVERRFGKRFATKNYKKINDESYPVVGLWRSRPTTIAKAKYIVD